MTQCNSCGAGIRDGLRFCKSCGKPLGGPEALPQDEGAAGQESGPSRISVVKLAVKAGLRSMALCAALLSPGMLLLVLGYTLPGMAWMFLASFALMAWTYRKPWRLGAISCLLPPLTAAACYAVQLWLLADKMPHTLLIGGAVALGIAVGAFRGKAHKLFEKDGAVFAQRTLAYLVIWAVAYAATQGLSLIAVNVWAVRGGLVTGAFSTAMLGVVSLLLWQQRAQVFRVPSRATAAAAIAPLLLLGALALPAGQALAQLEASDRIRDEDVARNVERVRERPTEALENFRDGTVSARRVGPDRIEDSANITEGTVDARQRTIVKPMVAGEPKRGGEAGAAGALQVLRQAMVTLGPELRRINEETMNIRSIGKPYGNDDRASVKVVIHAGARSKSGNGPWKIDAEGQIEATLTIERFASAVEATPASAAGERVISGSVMPGGGGKVTVAASGASHTVHGPYRISATARELSWTNYSGYDTSKLALQLTPTMLVGLANRHIIVDLEPEGGGEEDEGSMADGGGNGSAESGDGPELRDLTEEEQAAIAAVIAALIGAGIAVNVAQAVAAALAAALQAGAELTAEEVQAAVAEALLSEEAGEGDGGLMAPEPDKPPPRSIYHPDGTKFETNDKGEYWGPDEKGNWRWLSQSEADEAAAALREEARRRGEEIAEHDRRTREDLDASRRTIMEQHARERAAEADQDYARSVVETIRRGASRQGHDDIWERAHGERIYNEDGTIDTGYVLELGEALRNRIGRDMATTDPDFKDNSWGRIMRETWEESADDASNSLLVRGGLGLASGGWSEAFFQGRQTWNAVREAAEHAEDRGETMSATDAARVVAGEFANNNLPVNTIQTIQRAREGKDVSWGEIAMSLGADAMAVFDVAEAGAKVGGVSMGDAASGIGRRILPEDTFNRAAAAAGRLGDEVGGRIQGAVNRVQEIDARATSAVNRATGGVLENIGFGMPDRLSTTQARTMFESGEIDPKSREAALEAWQSGETRGMDEAFDAGRARGETRVASLEENLRALDEAQKSGNATPQQLADLERRVQDDVVRIQGDKHAMNVLNRRNSGGNGHPTIGSFNERMGNIHARTDERVIARLAEEYGVRPEDVQVVTITNVKGEGGGLIDPRSPGRPEAGHASSWRPDGSIDNSRAARSAPGTIDGPQTGRLPDAQPGKPSSQKVGMDRDLTMRVRTVDANGNIVYRDIPSSTTARIYNEEFFETATNKTLPEKAGLARRTEFYDETGKPRQGHSVDFKDTHLDEAGFIGDPLDIDDPQAFARRMDQATTDRLHPEAYGTGQGDLDTATKDAFRGRDLSDAAGTAKTIEFKVDHWMNEHARLQEMAAKPENAAIRGQLLEQAASQMEEAQRQLVKQYGNMVLKRTEAMQMLGNAPGATIPRHLTERVNVLKQVQEGMLTPAQAEAALKRMGTSTQDVARQMSAYVEGLQTARGGAPAGGGPKVVLQGWKDDFRQDENASRGG